MKKLIMVIGGTASGKTTFIKKHFADHEEVSCLNVWDYQERAYKEAGYLEPLPYGANFRCLMKANNELLQDVIEKLKDGNVVIEQTFFKAKRRIAYIDVVKEQYPDVQIVVYVMSPDDDLWKSNCEKRKLKAAFKNYKKQIEEDFEFPNPAEGFDAIYTVMDDEIVFRMDPPISDIVKKAKAELAEESVRILSEDIANQKRRDLLESMKTRPFWHYCEVCGKKELITAREAYDSGWDYPPSVGKFGMLSQRKCGNCGIDKTLWWRMITEQIVGSLSESERRTLNRIKGEPESLLAEETITDWNPDYHLIGFYDNFLRIYGKDREELLMLEYKNGASIVFHMNATTGVIPELDKVGYEQVKDIEDWLQLWYLHYKNELEYGYKIGKYDKLPNHGEHSFVRGKDFLNNS